MRTAFKISLIFFVVAYFTTLIGTEVAVVLGIVCFAASLSIAMLSYLNGDNFSEK